MPTVTISAILFAVCCVIGTIATWLACRVSHATGIMDYPGERKVHREPIAYLGGLGFTLTILIGTAIYATLAPLPALLDQKILVAFMIGLLGIFLVGLWDDVVGMRPLMKLSLQLSIALGLWLAGVRIERVTTGFGEFVGLVGDPGTHFAAYVLASLPSLLLTLGWYAALMNAINLIDGLDGLAGGVSLIAAVTLGVIGLVIADTGAMMLGMALPFITAGALVGFLTHNWHPARIFLGDSGSLSIGYVLATASLISSTKAPALLALLVPMVALALPLFETTFSFLRRIVRGTNPFKADRRHLHHRLLDAGLDQRRVVLVFLYGTIYFGVNAVLLAQGQSALLLINVALIGVGLLMLIEYMRFFERKRNGASEQQIQKPTDKT